MEPRKSRVVLGVCSTVFALVVWCLLPESVICLGDDFGYYRSILETSARLRPWTDEWLEPWTASLSVISAFVFKLTGSFYFATQGLQSIFAGASFATLATALRKEGGNVWLALVVSALVLTSPTLLWKQLEFTGMVLYLPCLLGALFFASERRWGLFAVCTAMALATRQSAVTWLVFPLVACVWPAGGKEGCARRERFSAGSAIVLCLLLFAVCHATMNRTHAQEVMTSHVFGSANLRNAAQVVGNATIVVFVAAGVAGMLKAVFGRVAVASPTVAQRAFSIVLGAGVGWALFRGSFGMELEHPLFRSGLGRYWPYVCGLVGLTGWLLVRIRWSITGVVGAFSSVALLCIRGVTWDYYYVDVALIVLFTVRPVFDEAETPVSGAGKMAVSWRTRMAGFASLAVLAVVHLSSISAAKHHLDNSHAVTCLVEAPLRQKRIGPRELEMAPFGYQGWHLYPYFIRHEGAGREYIANFVNYLERGALTVQTRGADDKRQLRDTDSIVASDVFTIRWRERHEFILRRAAASPSPLRDYTLERFPLNDEEWRQLAHVYRARVTQPKER